ncbi:HdeD family acid-resistance protein [Micromonospora sp. MS34]|uniref:HdeD family acid-resistance protein n=1 Tax=Micromonospora sp. MS34 TaxID=3385971 RepID=UPI0039A3737F
MFKSLTTSLLWRGILAVVLGFVSVAWPQITVGALVILFAVYAFIASAADAAHAFSSDRAGPVAGYLLLAVLSLGAGLGALFWPGITALVLTVWIAVWAVITGVVEIVMAFRGDKIAGQRVLWALSGLVSVGFGVVLAIRPDAGALTLATVFGLFAIVYGISTIVVAVQAKMAGREARRLVTT